MMATHEKEERERQARREAQRLEDDREQATATKRLREQFDSFIADLKDEEDDPEAAQEMHEPRQLLSDLPLKEAAVFDSADVQDSPEAEELSQDAMDDDLIDQYTYGQNYGVPDATYKEEDSLQSIDHQAINMPGQETARKPSNRDTESTVKPFSQDARGRSLRGHYSRAGSEARKPATLRKRGAKRGCEAEQGYRRHADSERDY